MFPLQVVDLIYDDLFRYLRKLLEVRIQFHVE
jgi:hypothetical protein